MKRAMPLFAGLFAAAGLAGTPAVAADFSSWWRIEAHYRDGTQATPICFFQQAGSLLAGTCKGPNALSAVEGQVNGNQIMFTLHFRAYTPYGRTGSGQFSGQMDSNGNMSGTSTNVDGVPGQFVAMRH